jgi:hypothetical protein
MSRLLYGILRMIKDGPIQYLSLIHGYYKYRIPTVSRRLPFLTLPTGASENVQEIETAVRFWVALVFLGSFLF